MLDDGKAVCLHCKKDVSARWGNTSNLLSHLRSKHHKEYTPLDLYNSNDSGVLVDPYSVEDEKWKDDVSLWPPVEFGEIYTYLIDTPGQFTREKMKAYKSLEAFNYYIR